MACHCDHARTSRRLAHGVEVVPTCCTGPSRRSDLISINAEAHNDARDGGGKVPLPSIFQLLTANIPAIRFTRIITITIIIYLEALLIMALIADSTSIKYTKIIIIIITAVVANGSSPHWIKRVKWKAALIGWVLRDVINLPWLRHRAEAHFVQSQAELSFSSAMFFFRRLKHPCLRSCSTMEVEQHQQQIRNNHDANSNDKLTVIYQTQKLLFRKFYVKPFQFELLNNKILTLKTSLWS